MTRQDFYAKRIGQVYGVYRVIKVEYDERGERNQKWTLECVKCGKIKTSLNWRSYVKGKNGRTCECMTKKYNEPLKETYSDKMLKHKGEIIDDWKIIDYEIGRGFLCECIHCKRLAYKQAKPLLEHRASKCVCRVNETKYDETWIGRKFNHLTIVNIIHQKDGSGRNRIFFDCVCDCGNRRLVRPVFVAKGKIKCCGERCKYVKENMNPNKLDFGSVKHPLYRKLLNMKARCENPKHDSYKTYGARGIKVCDEWQGRQGFYNFFKWSIEHGWKDGLTIDRIDPDGNYEPSNCRYITASENFKRTRPPFTITERPKGFKKKTKYSDVQVVINGCEYDIKTATKISGVPYSKIRYYAITKNMGWQEAFDLCILKLN